MALTQKESIFISFDLAVPIVFTLLTCLLKYFNRITKSLFLTYLWGIFIGCLWEIPFGLLGSKFLEMKINNPLGFGVHIVHAFWDSIIFLIGLYLVHIRNNNKYCGLLQLGLIILWGIFQNFIVELICNNNYWLYKTDNNYNPVLFTINGNSFTYVSFMVWVLFPIAYLSGVYTFIEKYGQLKNQESLNNDRTVPLLNDRDLFMSSVVLDNSTNSYTTNSIDLNYTESTSNDSETNPNYISDYELDNNNKYDDDSKNDELLVKNIFSNNKEVKVSDTSIVI